MKLKITHIVLVLFISLGSCKKDKRALVVGKIQSASKLATTEFTVDKIVHGTKTKKLLWVVKLSESRFLAYSKANIKTGIDLNKLKPEDITIDRNRIELILPEVEVINFSYPPGEFKLDTEITKNKFLNAITLENQEEFFRRAELDIRNNLEYMGLVETTQQHTRSMLTGLLKSLGYKEIYISFVNDNLIVDKVDLLTETETDTE